MRLAVKIFGLVLLCPVLLGAPAQATVNGQGGLNGRLVHMLNQVSSHFGAPVKVVSGCRSRDHNNRIGGARESWHLRCKAADIRVQGYNTSQVQHYLKSMPGRGGVGLYCRHDFVHLDLGPKREWVYGCNGSRSYHDPKSAYFHKGRGGGHLRRHRHG